MGVPQRRNDLRQLGMVGIAVEYHRLSGGATTPIEALADTCAALAWTRLNAARLGIDAHRVAAYGASAGGQLASAAATLGCGNADGSIGNGGPMRCRPMVAGGRRRHSGWLQKLLVGRAQARDLSPVEHVPARRAHQHRCRARRTILIAVGGAARFLRSLRAAAAAVAS